ncbi:uncharacterized protein LOC129594706 [Paramacrobiotus metropolitanus]|uniref:uncharacterized protein LOC129594706 n=1 Tax=Paramacrobiotus metropolitanus TaxID=2943436 RepID=UPI002445A199|nr:uncharacterized protein LOC129594706 [Paramacrobiotus metropolitanus]
MMHLFVILCGIPLVFSQIPGYPGNYNSPPNNYYQRKCGFPLVVPSAPDPNPEMITGLWYKYRQLGAPNVTVNQYLVYYPIGRTGLPFSTIPAEAIWVEIPQFDSINDTMCDTRFWLGLFGVNGQNPGQNSQSATDYIPTQANLYGLYFDYERVFIMYGCRKPNYVTGMCDQPVIHVITRARPDKVNPAELQYIDDIVDRVLAPYCMRAVDVPQQIFTDKKPFCPLIPQPECVKKIVAGMVMDVQNSIVSEYLY